MSVGVLAYSDWKSGNVSDRRNYLVKGISGAVSGAAGSLSGDIAEGCLGLDYFFEFETFTNTLINGLVGGVAGGIAGAFSHTIASGTIPAVNKITNGSFNQAKRTLLDIQNTKAVNLPKVINELFIKNEVKIPTGVVFSATTAREAVRLFKAVPIPVLEQSLSRYWNVLVTNGMRETVTSTLVGNEISENIMNGYKQITNTGKSSSDILSNYLKEYAY